MADSIILNINLFTLTPSINLLCITDLHLCIKLRRLVKDNHSIRMAINKQDIQPFRWYIISQKILTTICNSNLLNQKASFTIICLVRMHTLSQCPKLTFLFSSTLPHKYCLHIICTFFKTL